MAIGTGLQLRVTESKLQDMEKSARAREQAYRDQQKPEILEFAAHVRKKWEAAKTAKQGTTANDVSIKQRLLKSLRQRKGYYDPEKLAEIKGFGGSEVFMMLTNQQCRASESWIRDVLLPPGDKPWGIKPTPMPDLPEGEEIQLQDQVVNEVAAYMVQSGQTPSIYEISERLQMLQDEALQKKIKTAKRVASRFEIEIEDDLVEGNFYTALSEFIKDITTFPTAFIKGPIIRQKKKLVWTEDRDGNWVPAVEIKPVKEYERISPFDMYPGPGSKSLQDGYFCHRARLRRAHLVSMIGVEGFQEQAVRAVLDEHGTGGLRQWLSVDQERAQAEDRPQEYDDPDPPIDCVIYWGSAQGKVLREWGMDAKKIPDPDIDYEITAWLIGRWVVMARINPHPLGHRPYYSASYDSTNDSVWGHGPPELMRDCANICNAVARALVNNLGIASGPMAEVYMNRLAPGENAEEMHPWKVWKTEDDGMGANNPAVRFFQPNPLSEMLMKVYQYFYKQAAEQAGIPSYGMGSPDITGAGKTSSGLAMLMNNMTKTLRGVIAHIDEKVIKPIIYNHWVYLMLYDQEIEKGGDINVVARASEHLIIQEQMQLRRGEMLERTNNPIDMSIIGMRGRANMLRDAFDSLKMDADEIVPSDPELMAMMNQPPPGQVPPEVPTAAVVDAMGGAKGREPGRMMTPARAGVQ
uniref:Putative portal protein n=1 Tax=viral metagenome TaxID=1070528 RepID=A0A6M3IK50_9ZZZZ